MLGSQQRQTLDRFYEGHMKYGHKVVFNIGQYQSSFSYWSGNVHVSMRGVRGIPVYVVAIDPDGERHRYWISTCSERYTAEAKVEEIRKYLKGKANGG